MKIVQWAKHLSAVHLSCAWTIPGVLYDPQALLEMIPHCRARNKT